MHKKRLSISSSGGVGDSLIVGLKIQEAIKSCDSVHIDWFHFEKHQCHADPCLAIQTKFASHAECIITKNPEQDAMKLACEKEGRYLSTKVGDILNPYLDKQISCGTFFHERILGLKNYIVVQSHAGRMHDNTKREVGIGVINNLISLFPDKLLVLVGPKKHVFKTENDSQVLNLTGETGSIIDVFQIINDCSLFVGQDGVMAYYAMMQKKNTIVSFHLPTLPNHYWNKKWENHSIALVGGGNKINHLPNLPMLKSWVL